MADPSGSQMSIVDVGIFEAEAILHLMATNNALISKKIKMKVTSTITDESTFMYYTIPSHSYSYFFQIALTLVELFLRALLTRWISSFCDGRRCKESCGTSNFTVPSDPKRWLRRKEIRPIIDSLFGLSCRGGKAGGSINGADGSGSMLFGSFLT